jgi:phage-related protein (TIGR01555 family)
MADHALALATGSRSVERLDGWSNLTTGLGAALRDKRLASSFSSVQLSLDQCEDLYRGDDIAGRICDLMPADMTRQGWDVLVAGDAETTEEIGEALDALEVSTKIREALTWARMVGGAVILPVAEGGLGVDGEEDLAQPLNEAGIRSIDGLTVFDAREAISVAWYGDPQAPKYGETAIYRIQPLTLNMTTLEQEQIRNQEKLGDYSGLRRGPPESAAGVLTIRYVHESRILRFEGVRLTRRLQRTQWGWGDSVFVRLNDEIRDFQASFDSTSMLVTDFAQGVFKMAGLAEAIASGNTALVMARLSAIDMARSVVKAAVLDTNGEEFERKVTPVAGLADLLDRFCTKLAAAAGYPQTLLFGMSPAGMNATGESDITLYYDKVKDGQNEKIGPPLRKLLRMLFAWKQGPTGGSEPDGWSIQFKPLEQSSETEQADVRLKQAQADDYYVNNGVLTPEEVAVSRFGGDTYSTETQLSETDPAKRALAAAEAAESAAELLPDPAAPAKPEAEAPGATV